MTAGTASAAGATQAKRITGHAARARGRSRRSPRPSSPAWEESDDAFWAAISGAGEILHDGFDADLLKALLEVAEEGRGEYDDELTRRFAVEAIARALGAGHAESLGPPEGVTRADWAEGLLKAAGERLDEAARQA